MIQFNEIWKDVKDFSMYQISNKGQIRSWKGWEYQILKPAIGSAGYFQLMLFKDKKGFNKCIHRLVLDAFIGKCPKNHIANHKDGNKRNNFYNNLEWVTSSQNVQHAIDTGLFKPLWPKLRGERSSYAKLKDGEVWLIKKLLWHGFSQPKIAKMFKMSRGAIVHIKAGRSWSHIKFIPTDKDLKTLKNKTCLKVCMKGE